MAGGVGGAKLADGLAAVLAPHCLTVVVNTGDDFEHLGLYICPDLDTVTYTLAGLAHPRQGWGRADETWNFMETLEQLGGPTWFRLGDRDLALHVERTRLLQEGHPLSRVTDHLRRALGAPVPVLPMSDDRVRTLVLTESGPMPFQEYFVAQRWQPVVRGFRFEGAGAARPAPGVREALEAADLIVFCPSNPWVSLDPILAIPGLREMVASRPTLAVSPIVGGEALKGPAAKMFRELGQEPSAVAVARHFAGLVDGWVIDQIDADLVPAIEALGARAWATGTVMRSPGHRARLAGELLNFAVQSFRLE
jgi:LPPG:FO 2-phospho-L-lactate transferase